MGVISSVWCQQDADLAAIQALVGAGMLSRTAADAWALRTLTAPAAGLGITNPAGVAGNPTFGLLNDLAALEALSSTGLAARSATDTWVQRSIAGTSPVQVANGSGVAGNPTISVDAGTESAAGILQLAADGEESGAKALSADDGRLAGPWTAISLASGSVSINAPSNGFMWEIMLFIASSEAVISGTLGCFINGDTTTTNYWNQQMTGTNAASAPNEANSSSIISYAGANALTGSHALNRIIIPGYRDVYNKMIHATQQALVRAAGDGLVGTRMAYRTGASSGAVNDAVTSFSYTLPNSGTHAAGSYGYHRWVSA